MHLIPFLKKKFGKIGTILPGDAGDKGFFHFGSLLV
jgi:hypothetical protein